MIPGGTGFSNFNQHPFSSGQSESIRRLSRLTWIFTGGKSGDAGILRMKPAQQKVGFKGGKKLNFDDVI